MMEPALEMARNWGYSNGKFGFAPPNLDYRQIATMSNLKYEAPRSTGAIAQGVDVKVQDGNRILTFDIGFDVDQVEFPSARYGAEFKRAIESAAVFGNAVVKIRGHSDHWRATTQMLRAGMKNGKIERQGRKPNYVYRYNNRPFNIGNATQVAKLIETGEFENVRVKIQGREQLMEPLGTLTSAKTLSKARANEVRKSVLEFARQQGLTLDESQIQTEAVGILEPIVPRPRNNADTEKNRRVEFAIIRVPAEQLNADDFDF